MFRKNAVEAQAALNGRVRIAPPPSWAATNMLLIVVIMAAIIFISIAEYSRTIEIGGRIDSSMGTPEIKAPVTGYVTIDASEGTSVKEGEAIVAIEPRLSGSQGDLVKERKRQNEAQIEAVKTRNRASQASALAARDAARAREQAGASMLSSLQEQLEQSRRQTTLARADYERARAIADRGFVSKRELDERENAVAVSMEREGRIQAEIARTLGDISAARAEAVRAMTNADVVKADAQVEIAEAMQVGKATENAGRFLVNSPIDGIIASMPVRNGQRVQEGELLAIVTRNGDSNIARLEIPASNLTGIAAGQRVRVSVDAYPYQKYGTIKSEVLTISRAARQSEQGPVFDIEITMPKTMSSYGKNVELLPGMTVSARITTQERTILQWILDPLLAVSKR